MLGDDALVLSNRLSEWCGRAPDLEVDIALANIALDLLGQAQVLLSRAAVADPSRRTAAPPGIAGPGRRTPSPSSVMTMPSATPASSRPRTGTSGRPSAGCLVFATWRLAIFDRLAGSTGLSGSRDVILSGVAAKGVKELTYHRDFAARWFVTLAQGTPESRRRVLAGLDAAWRHHDELFQAHPVEQELAAAGVAVDPAGVAAEADAVLRQVLAASDAARPAVPQAGGRAGRDGLHTEALSRMLAQMQSVARAHPLGRW